MKHAAGLIILAVMLALTAGWVLAQPPGSDAPGIWEQRVVSVHGVQRLYYLYLPEHHERYRERPLIVNLHGSINPATLDSIGQRPEVFMFGRQYTPNFLDTTRASMMWKVAETEKLLVACPLSRTSPAWSWFDPTGNLEYINAMLDDIEATYGEYVDFDRVYATGFSGGGGMTQRLAYFGGSRFAAFGPLYYPMNTALYPLDAPEVLPRGLIQIANRYDPTVDVPYTEPSDSITILQTVAKWRDWCGIHFQNGQVRYAPIDTVVISYFDGSDLSPGLPELEFVTLFEHDGPLRHSYPKFVEHGYQANRRLWEFFQRFSLPADASRELRPDEIRIAPVSVTGYDDRLALRAYPNPFNAVTTVTVNVPFASDLTLTAFDGLGREVVRTRFGRALPGQHTLTFDGKNLASGVYFIQIRTDESMMNVRVLLVK